MFMMLKLCTCLRWMQICSCTQQGWRSSFFGPHCAPESSIDAKLGQNRGRFSRHWSDDVLPSANPPILVSTSPNHICIVGSSGAFPIQSTFTTAVGCIPAARSILKQTYESSFQHMSFLQIHATMDDPHVCKVLLLVEKEAAHGICSYTYLENRERNPHAFTKSSNLVPAVQ